ncbi:DUF262 domain-containing protein [Fulvivirgaceae bacterium PWU5]|uniref:DUF262 domain-containing protein n=1 Tax=Dawidia cretensis TaxID=2782350 RepID=A0AAP2GP90_9BACT|nr:DUF262 domain-containing protein [Dawidia cretensis]MBT1708371.1 DUF262 domain-containing protein [Dawidia cretensis]
MIQPEFKSLIDIVSNKLFRIPEYQRHYSWTQEQRADLFNDLKKLHQVQSKVTDRTHFMATVVCYQTKEIKTVGSTKHTVYEIVDGQQRITTLVILFKAIAKVVAKINTQQASREADDLHRLLVKEDDSLIILQNNHDNREILRKYLTKGAGPDSSALETNADKNLAQAIVDCEKFVDEWPDKIELLTLVKNSLFFVFHTVEDSGSVYTVFEVLNGRGLDVDWLDKTKSILMGLLHEYGTDDTGNNTIFKDHLVEHHRYWSDIYKHLGKHSIPGHEIIRFTATLNSDEIFGRNLGPEDSIIFFRRHCSTGADTSDKVRRIGEVTLWIKNVTEKLARLYGDFRRNSVTGITQARLLALAIMLRDDLSEADREILIDAWERVTFRIYGMYDKDSRSKLGDYVRAAKSIYNDSSLTVEGMKKLIKEIGSEYPIGKAIDILRKGDCYTGWQTSLRYFLFRYEEYLLTQDNSQLNTTEWTKIWKESPNNSIEHILPQGDNTPTLPQWKHFKPIAYKACLHQLGNLTLLTPGLNSEAGQNSFEIKLTVYNRVSLKHLNDVKQTRAGEVRMQWTENDIKERTEDMLKFASTQWDDAQ